MHSTERENAAERVKGSIAHLLFDRPARAAGSFFVGLVGWTATSWLHVTNGAVWLVAVGLGVLAAVLTPRPASLLSLWIGMLAGYVVGFGLGVLPFPGENVTFYSVLFAIAAGAGFVATRGIGRGIRQARR